MESTRDQMKEEMLAEAKAAIDKLLDWCDDTSAPNLPQIEDEILKLRKQLGQCMAEVVLREQEATQPAPGPICPTCQQEMRYKGMKEAMVESRLGTLQLERGYYYCPRCRSGLFPPR